MNKLTRLVAVLTLSLVILCAVYSTQALAQDAATPDSASKSEHTFYLGALVGAANSQYAYNGAAVASFSRDHKTYIDYGAHIGVDTFDLLDLGKVAFGFSYDNFNAATVPGASKISVASIVGQATLHNIKDLGIYFGLEGGFSIYGNDNTAGNTYIYGAQLGYEFHIASNVTIGPEVHYDRFGTTTVDPTFIPQNRVWKFLAAVNYYFH